MEEIKRLVDSMAARFRALAQGNAVVAKPITIGERHVVPLCELGLGFGGAGGAGEGEEKAGGEGDAKGGSGAGAGAAGGVKAAPVAVLVIDGTDVRLEKVGS
jgi:uncharacterized spore protein YtfJ